MTHLPECIQAEPTASRWPGDCICDRLRACEQRVMASDEPWAKASAAANAESYDEGYAAALSAARDAVAALKGDWVFGPRIYKHEALHAINSLREKP